MKISEKWLRSFVEINCPIQEIAESLTMRGLEIEEIAPVSSGLNHIVVAEILSAEQHPNADRLRVCQVNDGAETLTIVCGAPNARAGIKVALAKIGAVLPGVTIKKSKIRDVESHGMLCSVSELGLADKSEGIMELPLDAPLGKSLVEYLDLDDNVLDISITPNRGDCASVLGIAREVAAIVGGSLLQQNVERNLVGASGTRPLQTVVDVCPIYLITQITNINPVTATPIWMKERLRRSGVRSISVPVDVTNYVMFECGQPLHAFDAQKLQGDISVRFAKANETIELLNDVTLQLDDKSLIIADAAGPIALAGIMGGKRTAVSDTTTEIVLECAHFLPENIARTARHFNLGSDSSYRFERGVDPELPQRALELATQMILKIAGGDVGVGPCAHPSIAHTPVMKKIVLRYTKLQKVIGASLPETAIENVFSSLNMSVEKIPGGLNVTIPSYRFDLTIEEDLIEEVLRIHGFDKVEAVAPRASFSLQSSLPSMLNVDSERLVLKTLGYNEIISYSFVDEKLQTQLMPHEKCIKLMNPISQEMGIMRASLWTGLISTLLYNLNHHQTRVRLFEQGLCFLGDGSQPKKLSGLSYGAVYPESWNNGKAMADFFDVKNDVLALLLDNGLKDIAFLPSTHSVLHPTQSAQIVHKPSQRIIGEMGVLHPRLVQELDLAMAPVLFELDVHALKMDKQRDNFSPLCKFPEVRRDLSFLMPQTVIYQDIIDALKSIDQERIKHVFVFDVYQGKGIPEGQKSMAIALTLQDAHKTFTDDEVASLMKKVIDLIEKEFGAKLRD